MNDYSLCKNFFFLYRDEIFSGVNCSFYSPCGSSWRESVSPLQYPGILTGILGWDSPRAFSSPGRWNLQSEEISFCHSSEVRSLVRSSQSEDSALVFVKLHTVTVACCSSLSRLSLCKISLPPDMSTSPPASSPQPTWKGSVNLVIQVIYAFAICLRERKSHWLPLTVSLLSLISAGLSVPEFSGFCTLLIGLAENLEK